MKFTLTTWEDKFLQAKIIRLACNCCDMWAQYALNYQLLLQAYNRNTVFVEVIELITRFLARDHISPTKEILGDN